MAFHCCFSTLSFKEICLLLAKCKPKVAVLLKSFEVFTLKAILLIYMYFLHSISAILLGMTLLSGEDAHSLLVQREESLNDN